MYGYSFLRCLTALLQELFSYKHLVHLQSTGLHTDSSWILLCVLHTVRILRSCKGRAHYFKTSSQILANSWKLGAIYNSEKLELGQVTLIGVTLIVKYPFHEVLRSYENQMSEFYMYC